MATQTFTNCTVYLKSEMFGNIVRVDVREATVETGLRYAQYDNATKVTFLRPRERKARGKWITSYPFVVIVRREDAIEPEPLASVEVSNENGLHVRKSRYASFDERFVTDFLTALAAKNVQPLYQQISQERGW